MEPILPLTLSVLAGLRVEAYQLAKWRNSVPIRVHVNGTRGKSTTVKLLAAMSRRAGMSCIAKFTGGNPGWIDQDGALHPWPRRGPARLGEQHRFWHLAAQQRVELAVLECMAVDPYLQWVAERQITKATHTIITNVRPDHLEVMGSDLTQIAQSLANSIPENGHLILGAEDSIHILAPLAEARNTQLTWVTDDMKQALWQELGTTRHWSAGFLENAATAMLAAQTLGIPVEVSKDVLRDWPQETPVFNALWQGYAVQVINGLSANDPVSAHMLWDWVPPGEKAVAVYAHRADRPLRLQSFLHALEQEARCCEMLITGPIAKQHTTLRRWQAKVDNQTPWPITAVGTQAVSRRITSLVRQSTTPLRLILLGNELGLPPGFRSLVTPITSCLEVLHETTRA
jgi:poly-gamma-glutamate synthase PgsB/CapB